MYVKRGSYGHKQYIGFTIGPDKDVRMQGWRIWRGSLGYAARITLYTDWSRGRTYEYTFRALTRQGARNKIARQIRKWRRLEERYFSSVEQSK